MNEVKSDISYHGLCKSDQVKQSINGLEKYCLFTENKLKLFIRKEFDPCGSFPRGYFQIRRSGGGGAWTSNQVRRQNLGKVWPSSLNRRKNLGSFVTKRRKSWEKVHNFGVISEIQRAKFRVFVIYIFGGKISGSNKNFRGKIWGQAPRPPDMEVPSWGSLTKKDHVGRKNVPFTHSASINSGGKKQGKKQSCGVFKKLFTSVVQRWSSVNQVLTDFRYLLDCFHSWSLPFSWIEHSSETITANKLFAFISLSWNHYETDT